MQGVCNLPCFHMLYKDKIGRQIPGTALTQSTNATGSIPVNLLDGEEDVEESKVIDINFQDLYYKYANEQNDEMRIVAASCLHEAFQLSAPTEDIKKLQMTLLELLEEDCKEIMLALIPNVKILIEKFCNENALNKLPDATNEEPTQDGRRIRGEREGSRGQ